MFLLCAHFSTEFPPQVIPSVEHYNDKSHEHVQSNNRHVNGYLIIGLVRSRAFYMSLKKNVIANFVFLRTVSKPLRSPVIALSASFPSGSSSFKNEAATVPFLSNTK